MVRDRVRHRDDVEVGPRLSSGLKVPLSWTSAARTWTMEYDRRIRESAPLGLVVLPLFHEREELPAELAPEIGFLSQQFRRIDTRAIITL